MNPAPKLQGLIDDMSSEAYHGHAGTYSSSQLKTIREDPETFHRKYIEKSEEKESNSAFDIGTYFHTAVLEPHKLKSETAVFEGVRRGEKWESFKVQHAGKAIVNPNELAQAEGLVKAVKNSPVAMGRIDQGKAEISAFVDVIVSHGDIFTMEGDILGKFGWEPAKGRKPVKKDQLIIPLKVRADLLADNFILDLKSTTGNARNEYAMRNSVSKYSYDLSAALYLDLFSVATQRVMHEFVWTFASKDYFNSQSYTASPENIQIGRVKWKKAVLLLAEYIECKWQFTDYMATLHPNMWELEHLKIRSEDLL